MFEPKRSELKVVKSRLSKESWAARERAARAAHRDMQQIATKRRRGLTFNEAIRQTVPPQRRSWVIRRWPRWQRHGLEGVFDERKPPEPKVSRACEELVVGARLADRRLTVRKALGVLEAGGVKSLPSPSTVKRLLARADARRRYQERKARDAETAPVEEKKEAVAVATEEMLGTELLKAAEAETGAIAALTDEVERIAGESLSQSADKEPRRDVEGRAGGKFTAAYNRARRRREGEPIASYLRPAQDKARDKAGSEYAVVALVGRRREVLERKLTALAYESLVNPGRGWEGLRSVVAGAGLEALSGYPYMPATLSKLASELSQLGAGPRLLEVVGGRWHAVARERWGEPGAMAAFYVDTHAKEVWSTLFTLAGRVSHRSRVMPCITTTYVQTGAGTPVYVLVHSGSAPLSPRLGELLAEAEARLEEEVRRAVVIDAEGSTFDIFESFAHQRRVIVTMCKPSRVEDLELRYGPGSQYRPYRDGDELRVAEATLRHKSTGRELKLGALLVRREHLARELVLLTTGTELGWSGRALADLYFARWSLQENFFKDGAAMGLDRHRGNCGEMVTNVAVTTELESVEARLVATEEKLGRLNGEGEVLEHAAEAARVAHRRASEALEERRGAMDRLVSEQQTRTEAFAQAALAHHEALEAFEGIEPELRAVESKLERQQQKRQEALETIEALADRAAKLEPMQTIRQLDVALDSVLVAMKLTVAMLIAFVLREYMPSAGMSSETFTNRVLSTQGRRERTKGEERIVFYENPRDPRVNEALAEACERLNARNLEREGRTLRYAVEERPPPA